MTTSLIIKPEQKRLNRSIHTGVGQTNIRINLAPETGNRAQFARQMPEQRHHGSKRLDRSAEQRQGGREDVLLGECQLKAEMETIQQQMAEAKKNERANALKEVKRLCKQFGFTAGMLKGSLAKGRKKK